MTRAMDAEHVVVLSDVHGNVRALDAALRAARTRRIDRLVFLGDLLTYGPDVNAVVTRIADEVSNGAQLLLGNHDQMYLEIADGRSDYYDQLPEWIRASVDLVCAELDFDAMVTLPFQREWTHRDVLFAHANPFSDWRYLSTPQAQRDAATELVARQLMGGVFGHTHRPYLADIDPSEDTHESTDRSLSRSTRASGAFVFNAGSVGQPRERGAPSTILRLRLGPDETMAWVEDVDYDHAGHRRALAALPLPKTTLDELSKWF